MRRAAPNSLELRRSRWFEFCPSTERSHPIGVSPSRADVWTGRVVSGPQGFDDVQRFAGAVGQVVIQTLVPVPAIEALDEGILHRHARRDAMPLDPALLGLGERSVRGKLGAVIADDPARSSAQLGDPPELAHRGYCGHTPQQRSSRTLRFRRERMRNCVGTPVSTPVALAIQAYTRTGQ